MERFTPLEQAVLERMNSTGTLDRVLAASLIRNFLPTIGHLLGVDTSAGIAAIEEFEQLVVDMADAARFWQRGWAITEVFNVEVLRKSLLLLRETKSMELAEAELVTQLNLGERPLWFAVSRVDRIGWNDLELRDVARERARLVEKALAHHRAGRFDASVPIALAQVDGITYDLTSKSFFSSDRVGFDHLLDETSLLGMDEMLTSLRLVFGENVRTSAAEGRLSRHGILHGRELGYDTLANSTKALVLLGAVVNWAVFRGEGLVESRNQAWTGTDELDAKGRRRDRRGFDQAIEDLDDVAFGQAKYYAEHATYARRIGDVSYLFNAGEVLRRDGGFGMELADGGATFWAWRGTPSGYVFGVSNHLGESGGLRYEGFGTPVSPDVAPGQWHEVIEDVPSNWD